MHSTQNEGKSVVAKRFIRTLKKRIYKYTTSVSKHMYIDRFLDMSYSNQNKTCWGSSTHINFDKENNHEDTKFEVGDDVRIL